MSPRRKPEEPEEGSGAPSVSPAVAAVLSGLPTSLVRAATNNAPTVRLRLERLGPKTRALETNTARAPIFAPPSRDGVQLALAWEELPVHGGSFVIREARGPLSPREQHLLGVLHERYVRAGMPTDRRVPFSLTDAALVLGHGTARKRKRAAGTGTEALPVDAGTGQVGGRNREIVKEALRRIAAVSLESTVRYRDEHGKPQEETLGYRLVDSWYTTTRGGGKGSVTLSEPIAALLASGSVTYLSGPVWEELLARDLIAARLWTLLEADDLARTYSYALWASPPGEPPRERSMPALADLLRLRDGNRRRVAARIGEASSVIVEVDPRYTLEVVKSREPGMYRLDARRRGGAYSGTRKGPGGRDFRVHEVGTSAYAERDRDVHGLGTVTYTTRDPDVQTPARKRGVPSSSPVVFPVVEEDKGRTEETGPRPLRELLGPLDFLGDPRPEPKPAPAPTASPSSEVVERRRARARAILADPGATEAEREAARLHLAADPEERDR